MPPAVELLEEEDLELHYEELAKGNYQDLLTLDHAQAHQVLAYAAAKTAQWLVTFEQRMKT